MVWGFFAQATREAELTRAVESSAQQWRQCLQCTGSRSLKFAAACTNSDCDVFWARMAADKHVRDIEDCVARLRKGPTS